MAGNLTAQAMKDDAQIAATRQLLAGLGLNEDEVMPKLLDKFGTYSADFVRTAVAEPGSIAALTGEEWRNSKSTITHFAYDNVSDETLAKAVQQPVEAVKAKAAAYRMNHAAEEKAKPQEAKAIAHKAAAQVEKFDARTTAHAASSEVQAENTPETRALRKAEEKLAEMKEDKNGGNVSFDALRQNGASADDMKKVITGERLGEVCAGPKMKNMAKAAKQVDASMSGSGLCATGVNRITARRDTCNYDYRKNLVGVRQTYYRDSKSAKVVPTQGTATAQLETMHRDPTFVCFDFDSRMSGNPEIRNIKAEGTILGWPGQKNSIQPAGHITCLGTDGQWHTDLTESMDKMCGTRPAQRYGCNGKGKYCVIFTGDATLSDEAAKDILYEQYLREEQTLAKNKQIEPNEQTPPEKNSSAVVSSSNSAQASLSSQAAHAADKTQSTSSSSQKAGFRLVPVDTDKVRQEGSSASSSQKVGFRLVRVNSNTR